MRKVKDRSETKGKILDAAQHLMLTKGFAATGVDEICKSAGITKGSFFHYFQSKEDLGKEVLDRFVFSVHQMIQGSSARKENDPLKRVYGYIDFFIEMNKRPDHLSSCLLGNFAQELADTHPEIRALCGGHFDWWIDLLKQDLDEAKSKHAPNSNVDTRYLAEDFVATYEGALVLAKAQCDSGVIERTLLHFKQYLSFLFEK